MKTVAGVFISRADAESALERLRSIGLSWERLVLLTPRQDGSRAHPLIPASAMKQPSTAKAVGSAVGAAIGAAGGFELGAAVTIASIPGVGPVLAMGLLSAAVLGLAGAEIGFTLGDKVDGDTTEGLPADEIFLYEDALRIGCSVLLAFTADDNADSVWHVMDTAGAESVSAAHQQWWIGLRGTEKEHYSKTGKNFDRDEDFYRLGFEAALRAKRKRKEYSQIASEMNSQSEEPRLSCSNSDLQEAFRQGYERGRAYIEGLCKKSKAA